MVKGAQNFYILGLWALIFHVVNVPSLVCLFSVRFVLVWLFCLHNAKHRGVGVSLGYVFRLFLVLGCILGCSIVFQFICFSDVFAYLWHQPTGPSTANLECRETKVGQPTLCKMVTQGKLNSRSCGYLPASPSQPPSIWWTDWNMSILSNKH